MTEENENKALWIFKNFKETIDVMPKKYRGRAWEIIINYAFGEVENISKENSYIQMAVKSLLPLIKLRGKGGSKSGISNNPSGKSKPSLSSNNRANVGANVGATPYITETLTETLTETEIKKNMRGEYKNVYLPDDKLREFETNCLNKKLASDIICYLSEQIEQGKDEDFNSDKPNAHFVRLNQLLKVRRQHPEWFNKQEEDIYNPNRCLF